MDLKESGERMPQQIALYSHLAEANVVIFVRNINYIHKNKDSHYCTVYFQDAFDGSRGEIEVRSTLSDFEAILPKHFKMVNRSDLVNLRYITCYTEDTVHVWTPRGAHFLPNKNDVSNYFTEL